MPTIAVENIFAKSQYQPKYYPDSLDIAQDDPDWNSFQIAPNRLIRVVGTEAAMFVYRLHYWLQKPDVGVWKHGYRWIYNTAWKWQEQFPWLSEYMVGNYRRKLEKRGWIISNNFNRNPTDRTKYSTLDYWLIAQETGWNPLNIDLNKTHKRPPGFKKGEHIRGRNISDKVPDVYSDGEDSYPHPQADPESPSPNSDQIVANINNGDLASPTLQNGEKLITSRYKEFQRTPLSFTPRQKEKIFGLIKKLLGMDKAKIQSTQNVNTVAENCNDSLHTPEVIDQDKYSGAATEHLNNDSDVAFVKESNATNDRTTAKPNSSNKRKELPKKKGRQLSVEPPQRQKYEWEVAVGSPYPDFIWWRANRHYKPQGQHWADGAYSNAAAEIINKGEKALFLWQDFLREANRVGDNGLIMIANGHEPFLPEGYRQKPLDAMSVGRKLKEVKEFLEGGKLPESLQKKADKQTVEAADPSSEAPEEVKYVVLGDEPGEQVYLRDYTGFAQKEAKKYQPATKEQKVRNWRSMWKYPILRPAITKWVEAEEGVILTENGPVLDELPTVENTMSVRESSDSVSRTDATNTDSAAPPQPVAPTVPTNDAFATSPASFVVPEQSVLQQCPENEPVDYWADSDDALYPPF